MMESDVMISIRLTNIMFNFDPSNKIAHDVAMEFDKKNSEISRLRAEVEALKKTQLLPGCVNAKLANCHHWCESHDEPGACDESCCPQVLVEVKS